MCSTIHRAVWTSNHKMYALKRETVVACMMDLLWSSVIATISDIPKIDLSVFYQEHGVLEASNCKFSPGTN